MVYQVVDCIQIAHGDNIGWDGWLKVREAELATGGSVQFVGSVIPACETCGQKALTVDLGSNEYASYNLCLNCGDCRPLVYVLKCQTMPDREGDGAKQARMFAEAYQARKLGFVVWAEEYKPAPEQDDPNAPEGWYDDDEGYDWLDDPDNRKAAEAADAADERQKAEGWLYYAQMLRQLTPRDMMMVNCLVTLIQTAPPDTLKAVDQIVKDYEKEKAP